MPRNKHSKVKIRAAENRSQSPNFGIQHAEVIAKVQTEQ